MKPEILAGQNAGGAVQTSLAATGDFRRTAALNSMRDGSMGHGFGCGDGSCFDWHQRHVVIESYALCYLAVMCTGRS